MQPKQSALHTGEAGDAAFPAAIKDVLGGSDHIQRTMRQLVDDAIVGKLFFYFFCVTRSGVLEIAGVPAFMLICLGGGYYQL